MSMMFAAAAYAAAIAFFAAMLLFADAAFHFRCYAIFATL